VEKRIVIIDRTDSKIDEALKAPLYWTACICCKTAYISGYPLELFYFLSEFDKFTDKQKYGFYMSYIKQRDDVPAEAIQQVEELYHNIIEARKIKRKQKELLVFLAKAERSLHTVFSDAKTNVNAICEQLKIKALLPLACFTSEKWDKPLLVWMYPRAKDEEKEIERIKIVSSAVVSDSIFPFFPGSVIKQYITHSEINDAISNMAGVEFISELLLEFPEPIELTSPQVLALRNDVSQASDNLFIALEKLIEHLQKIAFEPAEFAKLADLYQAQIMKPAAAMQKSLDESADLQSIKKQEGQKTYKLYAALSSYQTILNIYNKLDIVDANTLAYAGEEVSEDENLEHTRLFLYLETS
jgi:hypothetical protein